MIGYTRGGILRFDFQLTLRGRMLRAEKKLVLTVCPLDHRTVVTSWVIIFICTHGLTTPFSKPHANAVIIFDGLVLTVIHAGINAEGSGDMGVSPLTVQVKIETDRRTRNGVRSYRARLDSAFYASTHSTPCNFRFSSLHEHRRPDVALR